MKALVILAILLGVMAMLSPRLSADKTENSAKAVALNYAVFRNAAFQYALSNKPSGVIVQSSLSLPTGWKALRTWSARVQSGVCYVYGTASGEEVTAARELLQGSLAVGQALNGYLIPDGKTPVPSFVPSGNLVSVVAVGTN